MADRNMVMSLLRVIIDDIMDIEEELSIMDEEEIEELVLVNVGSTNRRIIPKVIGFAEEVIPQYTETDFRRDFRVCKNTFERLIAELTPAIEYTIRESGKEGLPVRKQLLVYLWYISNQDSIREISRLFGVSTSTVHRCIRRVSKALCSMRQHIIRWPDFGTQGLISEAISERVGLPNVVGFIDGTHIRLSQIPNGDTDYINRKGYPSIVLQLVVDDQLLITDCYVGWPGSTHDARVYHNSPLHDKLVRRDILGQDNFIIGDGAYPLSTSLMTPFRDTGRLTQPQKRYNRIVSSVRQSVERAIGHLKSRFRRHQRCVLQRRS
ncbi:putative nuclease HARBI1 [Pecten maximus]|uniref:putative nuclease HARBI1 n=1 Tax=Pecten maximus TaxID=6579 RepID=UPI001458DA12|nr:putative nuclease HARBI1 [Pecten maximus]